MPMVKVAVIGGGSTYTPELIEGFIAHEKELGGAKIFLHDIDEKRLFVVGRFAQRMTEASAKKTNITLTQNLREALTKAHFVITQFRVGGMKARYQDEMLGRKHGVVGQETTGAGGFSKALRTIPVILYICRVMEKVCPNAWLLNFTNPSGLITEAVLKHRDVHVAGLCNVPLSLSMEIARREKAKPQDVRLKYYGLNHLSWIQKVHLGRKDITPKLLKDRKTAEQMGFSRSLLNALQMIPSPYLRYYYHTDIVLKEQQKEKPRAAEVMWIERELLKLYKNPKLTKKPKALEKRGGAYYSTAALSLLSAIYNDKKEEHIVNVQNNSTITDLPEDVCVEVPCLVGKSGPKPMAIGRMDKKVSGLVQAVKNYEELAIEAAVKGDKDIACLALTSHPLVYNYTKAEKILDDILDVHKPYLAQFAT